MEWIEVSKKLPPKGIFVLAYGDGELSQRICTVAIFHGKSVGHDEYGNSIKASDWMPLPLLPGA